MTKIMLGVIGVLIVLLIVLGLFLKHEISQNSSLEKANKSLSQDVDRANKSLKQNKKLSLITDYVVDGVRKDLIKTHIVIKPILERVDVTEHKVQIGTITPAVAASVYLDSMWQAYCESSIPDPHCAPRVSDSSLPNK